MTRSLLVALMAVSAISLVALAIADDKPAGDNPSGEEKAAAEKPACCKEACSKEACCKPCGTKPCSESGCAAAKECEEKECQLTCPVAGRPISASASADYNGGKVYFCCGGCKGKFEKKPEAFATQANHQLVASKQAKQTGCPISGNPCNPKTTAEVGGVEVAFCCGGCKGRVAKAEEEQQLELVFGPKAFAVAFHVGDEKEGKDDDSKESN